VADRAIVLQHKTQQPLQFELTDRTRESVAAWTAHAKLRPEGFLFPSRPADCGTQSLRRTKATLIYRRTKNLRAVQLLLGHRSR
jgi:integrase